ncbi:hypothetical protein J5U18_09180 [Sphingobacteriaceae bacterium WQ 2009]|uniref:HMA domain-containing protein n=1 Tax=Rhinopithecimicrobium faecis TaxID=2820698 RepID=A0A8T4HBC4_9SPHI|nr:hypothetical protein [Sphingobacteriaceae bacterium WQ 2009]
MENKELIFKTNLNCAACVAKVKADFDAAHGVVSWKVDTDKADKILTVASNGISEDDVITIVKSKGFKIEPLV